MRRAFSEVNALHNYGMGVLKCERGFPPLTKENITFMIRINDGLEIASQMYDSTSACAPHDTEMTNTSARVTLSAPNVLCMCMCVCVCVMHIPGHPRFL